MINIYVANLGKYNEGELVGDWFTLPTDTAEISKKIGLNARYEEYAIHDYEAPFKISEYANIEKLNEIAELLMYKSPEEIEGIIALVEHGICDDYETAIDKFKHECYFYYECENMGDVAYEIMHESGRIDTIPAHLQSYFNYDSYGRDLEIEGTFIKLSNNIYMEVWR